MRCPNYYLGSRRVRSPICWSDRPLYGLPCRCPRGKPGLAWCPQIEEEDGTTREPVRGWEHKIHSHNRPRVNPAFIQTNNGKCTNPAPCIYISDTFSRLSFFPSPSSAVPLLTPICCVAPGIEPHVTLLQTKDALSVWQQM